jgi:hypothetical protein
VYVRDTKLERTNHDLTPRHQGNLKRFLRDLHRGHEKEEKDKDRAKNEVARLNDLVSGTGGGESSSSSSFGRGPTPSIAKPQLTHAQRKAQVSQLAEMGISIPDEFRGEMAMAGEWQVTSQRLIDPEDAKEKRPEAIGFGVRKRPVEEDEEEVMEKKRTKWGSAYRTHPGAEAEDDLDALLSSTAFKPAAAQPPVKDEDVPIKKEEPAIQVEDQFLSSKGEDNSDEAIKEEPAEDLAAIPDVTTAIDGIDVKQENESAAGGVVFKKRKAKNIRQK